MVLLEIKLTITFKSGYLSNIFKYMEIQVNPCNSSKTNNCVDNLFLQNYQSVNHVINDVNFYRFTLTETQEDNYFVGQKSIYSSIYPFNILKQTPNLR